MTHYRDTILDSLAACNGASLSRAISTLHSMADAMSLIGSLTHRLGSAGGVVARAPHGMCMLCDIGAIWARAMRPAWGEPFMWDELANWDELVNCDEMINWDELGDWDGLV